MTEQYKWYAGTDGETYPLGPFDTQAEALQAGYYEGEDVVHVIEATTHDFKLSHFIDLASINEFIAEEYQTSDDDDEPVFDLTPAQELSLLKAIDDWQQTAGLKFTCQTFADVRNYQRLECVRL